MEREPNSFDPATFHAEDSLDDRSDSYPHAPVSSIDHLTTSDYFGDELPRNRDQWENFLDRPVPMRMLLFVVLVACIALIGFGSLVRTAASAGRAGEIAIEIASIPRTLKRAARGIFTRYRPYYDGVAPLLPGGFRRNLAQPFVDPGFILVTAIDEAANRPVVRLVRASDGVVLHDWRPDIAAINRRSTFQSALIDLRRDKDVAHNLMMHPLAMPDGGLVIHDSSPLARIDACGRLLWAIDGIFHHSAEIGPDGNIWVAYRYPASPMPGVTPLFDDEAIATVSPGGRLLKRDRIADILDRNGLGQYWRGRPYVDDPFHLNDIQPAMTSGRYWQRGDLFVSLRNLSMVMLYRPSTGRILWHREGPWRMQHDVSIVDDHRISIFDNHWRFTAPEGEVDGLNRVAIYDFATDRVDYPYAAATTRNAIRTRAQGRATPLANGDLMVEETEAGRLLRLAPDGTVRWRFISAAPDLRRYQLRWSRYLDPATDGPAIAAARSATCA